MNPYQQQQFQQQFVLAVQQYNEYNNQLQKHADEITANRQAEAKILAQLNENQIVKTEFDLLDDETPIFKLIGPVLVKQESFEAKGNVEKRIEFLKKEEQRLKQRNADLEKENASVYAKMAGIQQWIVKTQQQMQQMQQQQQS